MKKLSILLLAVMLLVSFTLFTVSCKETAGDEEVMETTEETPAEEVAEEEEPAAEEPAAEEPVVYQKELVSATSNEPKSLDPIYTDTHSTVESALFFDPLLAMTPDGEIVGFLAESYTVSDDGMDIVLKLRQGIKFTDGTDFNAEAVKWNLERLMADEVSVYTAEVANISEIIVVDDSTVEIKLSVPDVVFLSALCTPVGYMVSPTSAQELGEEFNRNPVGTGPYLFTSWVGGDRIVADRNPDYWRTDAEGNQLPYIDRITERFISEPAVALIELQSGYVDLITSNLIADLQTVEADPNLLAIASPTGTHQWCTFNTQIAPFDNEKLRQAVSAGIDRETIAQVVSKGFGLVTPTLIPPGDWIYDGDLKTPYAYDPALAKTLLTEAGYPDGIDIQISIIKRDPDVEIGQIIQSQLAEIGVNLDVEVLERQAWIEKVLTAKTFQMGMLRIGVPRIDPGTTMETNFGAVDAGQNWSGINDQAIFDLIQEAKVELDRTKRYDLYSQAQQLILDHAYYAFIFLRPNYWLCSAKLMDIGVSSDALAYNFAEMKLVE